MGVPINYGGIFFRKSRVQAMTAQAGFHIFLPFKDKNNCRPSTSYKVEHLFRKISENTESEAGETKKRLIFQFSFSSRNIHPIEAGSCRLYQHLQANHFLRLLLKHDLHHG